ncbi:MAG: hypothetical protein WCV85_04570 [Patescibacteria group bacterium]|jgi:hypothetical protein
MPEQTPDPIAIVKQLLAEAKASLQSAEQVLASLGGEAGEAVNIAALARKAGSSSITGDSRVIEGLFDGQHMVGPDGKQYSVPANYASKSKLVEGDKLKLTITGDGSFIYKQIGPTERVRVVGKLVRDEQTDEFQVVANGVNYRVLLASITYFKGDVGDDVVILLPEGRQARWAAVENIIKKIPGQEYVPPVVDPVVAPREMLPDVSEDEPVAVQSPESQDKIDEI